LASLLFVGSLSLTVRQRPRHGRFHSPGFGFGGVCWFAFAHGPPKRLSWSFSLPCFGFVAFCLVAARLWALPTLSARKEDARRHLATYCRRTTPCGVLFFSKSFGPNSNLSVNIFGMGTRFTKIFLGVSFFLLAHSTQASTSLLYHLGTNIWGTYQQPPGPVYGLGFRWDVANNIEISSSFLFSRKESTPPSSNPALDSSYKSFSMFSLSLTANYNFELSEKNHLGFGAYISPSMTHYKAFNYVTETHDPDNGWFRDLDGSGSWGGLLFLRSSIAESTAIQLEVRIHKFFHVDLEKAAILFTVSQTF
jgi:hypothetical protein